MVGGVVQPAGALALSGLTQLALSCELYIVVLAWLCLCLQDQLFHFLQFPTTLSCLMPETRWMDNVLYGVGAIANRRLQWKWFGCDLGNVG